uniref:Uncharacterized protein n=1 Tax=Gopherus agassizii TaxID=38772 RepID=A0A452GY44_9SAUR
LLYETSECRFPNCCCFLFLFSALTEGYVGSLHENRHGSSVQIRRRKASGDSYWAYSGELTHTILEGNVTGTLATPKLPV